MYVYRSVGGNDGGWEVGHYNPQKNHLWVWDGDYETEAEAALRCHWLNGGNTPWSVLVGLDKESREMESSELPSNPYDIDLDMEEVEELDDDPRIQQLKAQRKNSKVQVQKSPPVQSLQFEGVIDFHHEDSSNEDNGQYIDCRIVDDMGCAEDIYIRICSWDDNAKHTQARSYQGKKVRINLEITG